MLKDTSSTAWKSSFKVGWPGDAGLPRVAWRHWGFTLLLAAAGAFPPADAGEIMDAVKTRGELRCGVSEGIPGFSEQDVAGRWRGLDADFCRAMAAAVLGDGEKVTFTPLKASARFPALQARQIDLLARNTTWTMTREILLSVQFPAVLFYDAQGFLVPRSAGIASATALNGATLCVEKGTTHTRNLEDYFGRRGLSVKPLVIDSTREVADAFFAGRCRAYTADVAHLAAVRARAPGGPDAFAILPERISKEPLAPVVLNGDQEWIGVTRWVLYGLLMAEEIGVTRENLEHPSPDATGLLIEGSNQKIDLIGKILGLNPGWMLRAVKAVGNYGEIYERHLGSGSALGIERGLNRLWNQGGLMYAPPLD